MTKAASKLKQVKVEVLTTISYCGGCFRIYLDGRGKCYKCKGKDTTPHSDYILHESKVPECVGKLLEAFNQGRIVK